MCAMVGIGVLETAKVQVGESDGVNVEKARGSVTVATEVAVVTRGVSVAAGDTVSVTARDVDTPEQLAGGLELREERRFLETSGSFLPFRGEGNWHRNRRSATKTLTPDASTPTIIWSPEIFYFSPASASTRRWMSSEIHIPASASRLNTDFMLSINPRDFFQERPVTFPTLPARQPGQICTPEHHPRAQTRSVFSRARAITAISPNPKSNVNRSDGNVTGSTICSQP